MEHITKLVAEIEMGHDLEHYAAHAAASTLVENWNADGKPHPDDVKEVIRILRDFEQQVRSLQPVKTA